MEDILRLELTFVSGYPLREGIFRAFVVLAGVILLCLCVNKQSIRYHELTAGKNGGAQSRIFTEGFSEGHANLCMELTEETNFLKYGINLYNPEFEITKYVSKEWVADDIETGKGIAAEADINYGTRDLPGIELTKRNPEDVDSEEDNLTTETPKAENPEEVKPLEIKVTAYGNGGFPEVIENTFDSSDFTADVLSVPKRPGKMFTGWYEDAEGTIPFGGVTEDGKVLILYAGWSEFPGFISNDSGYIIGCTEGEEAVFGGLLVLPSHESCIGIEKGAFDGQADLITDVYIPKNITYIEPGTFDTLPYLMFIEAAPGNPVYSSIKGVLYDGSGNVAAYPAGRNSIGR